MKKRTLATIMALSLIGAALAGCGGAEPSRSQNTTLAAATTAEATTAATTAAATTAATTVATTADATTTEATTAATTTTSATTTTTTATTTTATTTATTTTTAAPETTTTTTTEATTTTTTADEPTTTENGGEPVGEGGEEDPPVVTAAGIPENIVEATIENPAKLGEWIEIKKLYYKDNKWYPAYCRAVSIETGDAVTDVLDKMVERNYDISAFDSLEESNMELRVLNYELYYPEDYPRPDYGITSGLNLSVQGVTGAGVRVGSVAYIGLYSSDASRFYDITVYPGEVFYGKLLFAMVQGHTEYHLYDMFKMDEDGEYIRFYIRPE